MRYFISLCVILMLILPSLAQDPTSPEMNWCNEGGPMAGKCTIPGDEALTNYLWETGWYLAAVDRYEIALSDVPERYIKRTDTSVDDITDSSGKKDKANCKPITLPGFSDSTVTVTGELIYEGVTYISQPVPANVYETFAEGETYDPSIIGDKHKVVITGVKGNGKKTTKTYRFNCDGVFDATAGGLLPTP